MPVEVAAVAAGAAGAEVAEAAKAAEAAEAAKAAEAAEVAALALTLAAGLSMPTRDSQGHACFLSAFLVLDAALCLF
jgi:hypothetical protein